MFKPRPRQQLLHIGIASYLMQAQRELLTTPLSELFERRMSHMPAAAPRGRRRKYKAWRPPIERRPTVAQRRAKRRACL